jgi:hypothetical protein
LKAMEGPASSTTRGSAPARSAEAQPQRKCYGATVM